MSKTINIGGRLHSTEVGNVLVGANEVLDDTKQKKQNVINAEVDAEMVRLDQSKQNNLTFDNAPTEDSTNPVTSGGVYAADKVLSDAIEAILLLIPSAATALNKLADMAFVNSSVSTATATFRGTYNVVTDLELAYDATHEQIATKLGQVISVADNNDYAYVQVPVSATSTDIRRTERYKFNGSAWGYEYDLNTSGFTAAQWNAINSGITAVLVAKLTGLPTAEVLATMFAAKQDTLTFDSEPTALSTNPVTSGGVYSAILAVSTALSDYMTATDALIPSEATSTNKLTDKDYVDGLIEDITELIPSEATTSNQLADKAYVLAQILAATPAFKGQFTTLADLQAVASPKAGDIGIVRTKDNDGKDVFTFYQYLSNAWNVYYTLSYHPQTKPATTGTTGDYPYNGMGRVELPKNIVEGVNTLTQSMMPTATGGNTIYVIQYDFTLGEDITVPANCVLEFDGGSISGDGTGKDTITGTNTQIIAPEISIFTGITIAGIWNVPYITSAWFSDITQDNRVKNLIALTDEDIYNEVIILEGTYAVSIAELNIAVLYPNSNTKINLLGTLQLTTNNIGSQRIIGLYNAENVTIIGTGSIIGDKDTHVGEGDGACEGIRIAGVCKNITIHGIEVSNWWTDGLYIGGGDSESPVSRDNVASDILIRGLKIHDCRRQGISVTKAHTLTIEQCEIYNISGTAPQSGIDIEPNTNNMAKEICIRNNYIHDCAGSCLDIYASANVTANFYFVENVLVENNTFYNPENYSLYLNKSPKNVVYINNIINGKISVSPATGAIGNWTFINNKMTIPEGLTSTNRNSFTFDGNDIVITEGNISLVGGVQIFKNNIIVVDDIEIKVNEYNLFTGNKVTGKKIIFSSAFVSKNRFNVTVSNTQQYIIQNIQHSGGEVPITSENVFIIDEIKVGANIYTLLGITNGIAVDNIFKSNNQITVSTPVSNSGKGSVYNNSIDSNITITALSGLPAGGGLGIGSMYYNYANSKLCSWNGTAWVDATGTPV